MRVNYHPEENAVYIRFHEAPYHESDEVRPGVIVDYDRDGRVIGLEVLNVSKNLPKSFVEDLMHHSLKLEMGNRAFA